MLARVLLFNVIGIATYAKVISMDICADAWVLEQYAPQDIGAVTFLTQKAEGLIQHRGTTEEILALRPSLVVTDYPLSEKQKRKLEERNIVVKTLLPLNRLSDLYQRFPQSQPVTFSNIGHGRTVIMLTHSLHSPGGQTFWNDVLKQLGFKNATAIMGVQGWRYVSTEQILVAKPAMLVVLGENVVLPSCLKHIPVKHVLSKDYLCPSPEGIERIMEVLV